MNADLPANSADENLESDLENIRSVLGERDSGQPPQLLDTAVLNSARRELEDTGKTKRGRFSLRWLSAFATASVMILALGILVQQEQESVPVSNGDAEATLLQESAGKESAAESPQKRSMMKDHDQAPVTAASRSNEFKLQETASEAEQLNEEADETLPPEQWLQQILLLKSTQQEARLAEELAAFTAVYPDYPLPPELGD